MNNEKKKVRWLLILVLIVYVVLALLFYRIENHMEKVEKWMEQMDEKKAQRVPQTVQNLSAPF